MAKILAPAEIGPNAPGELLVQHLTGLPVIWKPLDPATGRSQFDAHPEGEGYGPADYRRDAASGLYSERQLAAWRAGVFDRVRCTQAEAEAHWGQVALPAPDPFEEVKALLGSTTVALDAALADLDIPASAPETARRPVRAYTTAALDSAAKTYALDAGQNIIRAEWVAAAPAYPVSLTEVEEKQSGLDTKQNSILTVGSGMAYSTISAAVAAASAGDFVAVYAGTYSEVVTISIALYVCGMVANQGVIVTSATTTFDLAATTAHITIENLAITTTAASGGYGVVTRGSKCRVSYCKIYNGGPSNANVGLMHSTSNYYFDFLYIGCSIFGFLNGTNNSGNRPFSACDCSVSGCVNGFNCNTTGNLVLARCIAAGNTTDFANVAATSTFCVSGDATAPGVAAVTGFATTDWENQATGDLRLKAAVAATTAARFIGYPADRNDARDQVRRRSGYFYAGWHDPDPGRIPTAAEVDPLAAAFGLDNELTPAMDVPALTSVVPPDTLRGVEGTYTALIGLAKILSVRG